ncbi:MAG: LamG domain-containing protein, partial [bacterium]|nr:LamG domain-containing protein [bacterium]
MSTEVSKVLQFDGTDDAVELGTAHVVGLQAGDFTVEAWVRLDALAGDYLPILGTDTASPDHGLHLAIKNHRPYLGFYDNDTAGQSELATGVWYHLAWRFTAEGGEQAIFLNGVLDASATEKSPFAGVDETVYVGRYAVDHHFPGQIAELRIWRVARTAEEILAGM